VPSSPRPLATSDAAALALVAAAIALVHAGAVRAGFVFDARVLVLENPTLRDPSWAGIRYVFTHDYWQPMATDGLYRPLTILSFLADWSVLGHGDRPAGYLVENVVLHVACAVLLALLVRRLSGRLWPAAVAALLFGVHPVATEAVANVVGRADLLATAGVLGGLVAWAHGRDAARWRRAAWGAALAAAAVVAVGGKETGLVLAAAIPLYDVAIAARPRLRVEHVVVALVVVGYLAARAWVAANGLPAEDVSPIDNPIVEAGFVAGRLTAVSVLARELALVAWPATLSADYSWRQIPLASWPPEPGVAEWTAAGLAAVVAGAWLLARVRRSRPDVFFFGGLAVLALVPTANLLVVIGSIVAERFLYLPLAGLAAVAALLADRGSRATTVVVGVVAVALAARTVVREADWRDELGFWTATVAAAPESAKAAKGFAAALFVADENRLEIDRVLASAERAVAIRPDYEGALADLGGYQVTKGDVVATVSPDEARGWWERAVVVLEVARELDERSTARFVEKMRARGHGPGAIPDVGDGPLYRNLALAYQRTDRLEDARGAYETIRRLKPVDPASYRDLADVLESLGRWEDAAVTLMEATFVFPADVRARRRLGALYQAHTTDAEADVFVRRHRCRAWRELTEILSRAQLARPAADAHREAVESCQGD
jgi:protein O-mannosyl-transferase